MFQNLVLGDRGGMEVAVEKLRPWFAAWLHRHRSHLQSTEPASERTSCPAFRLQPVSFRNDLLFALWYSSLVADVVSKEKRSQVMAAIRSKGNKATELKLVSILRATGITGWLRHRPLPGRPDFIFRRQRLAIFVDGCFWHGCRWHCRMPQDTREYWLQKITGNAARDRSATQLLRRRGWSVLRIWGHELETPEAVARRISSLLNTAQNQCNNTRVTK